ncbi:GntR family transcriptional regulator [Acidobacterium sp. S8]|uniref:GntR family transcriptional regulator n=1 Tax=Acidobacterium sp. S8 TaxID=1641854 RepID=UPI00131E206A|nr:GntR family transcriptional regulator [Acidobacterium sp. S8]
MRDKSELRTVTATERVEEHIRQAIYKGALKPRERIIEEDVAKQLECSRGPVREAFLRLERDGLIVTVARRGTFIRDISASSIEVIFSMRSKLEALCVRYLREQMTGETEQLLRDALKKMKAAAVKNDDEAFLDADMHFHQTIWKLSNRVTLENTLSKIMNPFIFMLARAYSSQTPIAVRYKKHARYLETILTEPVSKVEHSVEHYFRELAIELLSKLPPQF